MVPIILPSDTPLCVQILVAGIVVVSLYFFIRAYWRSGALLDCPHSAAARRKAGVGHVAAVRAFCALYRW